MSPNSDPKGRRLVGYLRVSTQGQVKDGYGLPIQRQEIQAWAKHHGARILAWYSDDGVSGTKDPADRPGLRAALEHICYEGAEGLVVAKLDRLARKIAIQEATLAHIWRCGGDVFAVDQGYLAPDSDDDEMRYAFRLFLGVFSDIERKVIVNRLRKGRAAKAAEGKYAYGKPPYGWRAPQTPEERAKGLLVADEHEQGVLERILVMHRTLSINQIVNRLNEESIAPRQGKRWHVETVRRILARQEARS